MPKFIVERDVPGIGDYPPERITGILNKTRAALKSANGQVHWLESFVTTDKVFSIYVAADEAAALEFSKLSPLPTGSHPPRSLRRRPRHRGVARIRRVAHTPGAPLMRRFIAHEWG